VLPPVTSAVYSTICPLTSSCCCCCCCFMLCRHQMLSWQCTLQPCRVCVPLTPPAAAAAAASCCHQMPGSAPC
jgi:hypothetical protein